MKDFLFIEDSAIELGDDLVCLLELCLVFNPLAKARKKKKWGSLSSWEWGILLSILLQSNNNSPLIHTSL